MCVVIMEIRDICFLAEGRVFGPFQVLLLIGSVF